MIECFHGTSTGALATAARSGGLDSPYATPNYDIAAYYAEEAAADDATDPVVVSFVVEPSRLRYDGAAMDEPVMADETSRDDAWGDAARAHPEWVTDEYLCIPDVEWRISWDAVASARVDGTVADWEPIDV